MISLIVLDHILVFACHALSHYKWSADLSKGVQHRRMVIDASGPGAKDCMQCVGMG